MRKQADGSWEGTGIDRAGRERLLNYRHDVGLTW